MKKTKEYTWEFLKDYGPPTVISLLWGFYIVYQNPDGEFWETFFKNFVPAFFGLNWFAMRFNRTRKTVQKKEKSKRMAEEIESIQEKLDRIEKILENDPDKSSR
jgi:hypothetical protein